MEAAEIIDEVKRLLKEPETGGHWDDETYIRRMNLVQTDFAVRTRAFESSAPLTPLEDMTGAIKPKDCIAVKSIRWGDKLLTATNEGEVDAYAYENVIPAGWRTVSGTPVIYIQNMANILLYKQPLQQYWKIDNTLQYYRTPEKIVSLFDDIMEGVAAYDTAAEAIIDGMMTRFMQEETAVRNTAQMAVMYAQRYEAGIQKFILQTAQPDDDSPTFKISRQLRQYPQWVYDWISNT